MLLLTEMSLNSGLKDEGISDGAFQYQLVQCYIKLYEMGEISHDHSAWPRSGKVDGSNVGLFWALFLSPSRVSLLPWDIKKNPSIFQPVKLYIEPKLGRTDVKSGHLKTEHDIFS